MERGVGKVIGKRRGGSEQPGGCGKQAQNIVSLNNANPAQFIRRKEGHVPQKVNVAKSHLRPHSASSTLLGVYDCPAACALMYTANAFGFLVCMNTVPGPVNLQTNPSPALMPEMMPPLATRSSTYLQFHATR